MAYVGEVHRYAEVAHCSTALDPIADCTAWITGLRSTEYCGDLLRLRHGFSDRREIAAATKAVRVHVQSAVEFLDQANGGPRRSAYLPLYYAMLNLAKIAIVFRRGLRDLEKHRHHGASWSGIRDRVSDLQSDHITVHEKGAISLLYRLTVGTSRATLSGKVSMRQIYPFIGTVGFEYAQLYKEQDALRPVRVCLSCEDGKGWRADVAPSMIAGTPLAPKSPLLTGLRKSATGKTSRWVAASDAQTAHSALGSQVKWWLLYHESVNGQLMTLTPTGRLGMALPQEFPVLLALFHLSNVVRYDPDRLARLYDSRSAPVIEALRRHGLLTYLVTLWSFFTRQQHVISAA